MHETEKFIAFQVNGYVAVVSGSPNRQRWIRLGCQTAIIGPETAQATSAIRSQQEGESTHHPGFC